MSEFKQITITRLFPKLLNLHGDDGNIAALSMRLKWRGIDVQVENIGAEDFCPDKTDILYIGGGEERDMLICLEELKGIKDKIREYIENDGIVLAVCEGFEIMGSSVLYCGKNVDGLNLLDMDCTYSKKRITGNVAAEFQGTKISGFENHSAYIDIKGNQPFAKVINGGGNNGKDSTEGIIYKNFIGTNLHGPILPKNPTVSDYILSCALKKKYGDESYELKVLDDTLENSACEIMLKRVPAQ